MEIDEINNDKLSTILNLHEQDICNQVTRADILKGAEQKQYNVITFNEQVAKCAISISNQVRHNDPQQREARNQVKQVRAWEGSPQRRQNIQI